MKKLLALLMCFVVLMPQAVHATADLSVANNKYGIHVAQFSDEDLKKSADLVNSNGGKWGYITLVIQENDRDKNKWQGVFDKLRELKLIPIVRLATKAEGPNWRRPSPTDADEWVTFLNSLNWVVKNRYIILFNEPNHATEWGGAVDPVSFAVVNKVFAQKLKATNSDYFIMMGGMDAAAPSQPPRYEDSGIYLRTVINTIGPNDFNQLFDGLSSHSYPNPGFVGSPLSGGKSTVRGYEWELDLFKSMGVKELPVFITETGWNANALGRETVAQNFRIAFENIWMPDGRVIAVTPFVLNYQGEPFAQFSWLTLGSAEPQPEYRLVQGLSKQVGRPIIIEAGDFTMRLPKEIVAESTYHFKFTIKNTGQGIWNKDDYRVELEGIDPLSYITSDVSTVKPFESRMFEIFFKTSTELGKKQSSIVLYNLDRKVLQSQPWLFEVLPLPSLQFKAALFPKTVTNGEDFELQIFDSDEELIFRQENVSVEKGIGLIEKVENITLDDKYRVVLLKKHYLPAQTFVKFTKGENTIEFKQMYPFDFNADGGFDWKDIMGFFTHWQVWGLWLPGNS